eukprot:13431468-Alexandrium_andersonii.AAC.1
MALPSACPSLRPPSGSASCEAIVGPSGPITHRCCSYVPLVERWIGQGQRSSIAAHVRPT